MINGFELTKEYIIFADKVDNWEEAIKKSSEPLLENGYIKESYVQGMIDSVKEFGPYIVIAPNFAMPHARPEKGAVKAGFSILKLKEAVSFSESEEHNAQLLIALSCADANTHIESLQKIAGILSDTEKYERLFNAENSEEILEIFK